MKRLIFEKTGKEWKFSPPRFLSIVFMSLIVIGYLIKWIVNSNVESLDFTTLGGLIAIIQGAYEYRRKNKGGKN